MRVSPVADALADARERTLALVAPLSDADVERQHIEILSPLVWDLAHIAAYEELWLVHRFGDRPLSSCSSSLTSAWKRRPFLSTSTMSPGAMPFDVVRRVEGAVASTASRVV